MDVHALAAEFGFAECYVFKTETFDDFKRRYQDGALHSDAKSVRFDIAADAPWANVILGLVYPYRPFADNIPVSGYYPSSNFAYHASGRMMLRMQEENIRVERAEVPVRELLTRNGIGIPLKNGLTAIPKYGTRYYLQTLLACMPEPSYTPAGEPRGPRCDDCHACEKICPSGAISSHGYDVSICARAYMCGEPMDRRVMDAMSCMLGCELCQRVCPYNKDIEPIAQMPDAFRLEELLGGNIKPALEIVGKNLNRKGRLIQHACVIAAKQGRTDLLPLIERWKDDSREGVRVAAEYAREHLQNSTEK